MSDAARLLENLDDQQRVAAETLLGPVCLLAGAGTGKTRAVTHRIAYGVASGVYPPGRVMALTFTARAAGELRSRLRALGTEGVTARTFHASALSQLNFFWPQVIGGTMPRLLDSKARLLAHAADGLRLRLDTATLRDVAAEIEWRKTSRLTLAEYAARNRPAPPSLSADRVVDLQEAYERLKDERRQLDFEDVLLAAAGMIEAEPRVAQQVREQYRFFVVDEYQDVSPLQHDLLRLWLGSHSDVCVVGDVSQTIYTFAGASPDYLLGFGSEFSEATVLRLEHNYRSTPAIVSTANRLMRGRPGALELTATSAAGPEPTTTAYESDQAEAKGVAASIAAQLAAGVEASDIAVLFRINAQSQLLESALQDAGVPYQVRGATRFFEQREVVEAIMLLRGATVGAVTGPLERSVGDVLSSIGWSAEPPETAGAVRSRWESLDALMRLAREAPEGTSLRSFVEDLAERQAAQHEPTLSAVTLTTIHSAKGLEWESVYLVGLAEGLLPLSHAKDDAAIEEERRLLYVGITRARRSLALSWAGGSGGSRAARKPSRFLSILG
ncbi:DNA helicase-2/ATP-dependent DNA helicase PcrA [Leifsonia sp. AK011]|uniref:ATP-dependent helicase n=1 Tax=Leifsonia sp. AK011 TaxID=2723075 RepID=UPI0015CE0AFC|nr:ATP-dependent helicase [Leifsonia sp. AK011]NYF10207.1 DNA helicase-2/ATP-dependent DNA helicase PcrA [Leifsonia sp. AK011]